MKAVKKYESGGKLTEEEKRRIRYRIQQLKGEIGVVKRTSSLSMPGKDKANEIKRLQKKIDELQAKL